MERVANWTPDVKFVDNFLHAMIELSYMKMMTLISDVRKYIQWLKNINNDVIS